MTREVDRAWSEEPAARLLAAGQPVWNADDSVLVCRHVRDETHDVKTFVLASTSPRLFRYRPGQFLTFAFEIGGMTVHRCYTIASAPTRPHTVSITVKRVPGGPASNWLHDNLTPFAGWPTTRPPPPTSSCLGLRAALARPISAA